MVSRQLLHPFPHPSIHLSICPENIDESAVCLAQGPCAAEAPLPTGFFVQLSSQYLSVCSSWAHNDEQGPTLTLGKSPAPPKPFTSASVKWGGNNTVCAFKGCCKREQVPCAEPPSTAWPWCPQMSAAPVSLLPSWNSATELP